MADAPADPLIEKAVSDWTKVANGAHIDDFRQDLLSIQKRDVAAGGTRWIDDRDKLNERLAPMLPNLQFFDVTSSDVVVSDPTRSTDSHPQLGVLREDRGLLREEDLDVEASAQAGKYVTKPALAQPLYDHPDTPLTDIKPENAVEQTGNCHFTSTLSDLAKKDPEAIKQMIAQNADGSYTVTFPGDKDHPVTVGAPNQWELETFATKQGGIWAAVAEKAYRAREHTPFNPPNGGSPKADMRLLTGKPAITLLPVNHCWFPSLDRLHRALFGGVETCGELNSGESLSDLIEKHSRYAPVTEEDLPKFLAEAEQSNTLMVAGSLNHPRVDPVGIDGDGREVLILPSHDYTVTHFDPASKMITLRNPWGYSYDAQTSDPEGDGYVTMPFSQFLDVFDGVDVGKLSRTKG